MNLLATLRPPTRDEASRAYRDRIAPPPEALAGIAAVSSGDPDIAVEITSDEVRVFERSTDVEKDAEGGATREEVESAAVRALEALQLATGWYVFGALEDGFEPEGQCESCSIERFAWQDDDDACPACGAAPDGTEDSLDKPAVTMTATGAGPAEIAVPSTNESIAEALVDALLENEWVELVTSSSRKALIHAVAEFLVRHPGCREPAGASPAEPAATARRRAPALEAKAPSPRALAAMPPRARAEALADAAARAPAVVAARARRDALVGAAPKGNPGYDLLDYLTDLPYVAEVYADEDALAALLRGSAAPAA